MRITRFRRFIADAPRSGDSGMITHSRGTAGRRACIEAGDGLQRGPLGHTTYRMQWEVPMIRRLLALAVLTIVGLNSVAAPAQTGADADIITTVRAAIAARDFARGEELLASYRAARGTTPEAIEALSWMARGAFAAKQLDNANRYAVKTYDQAVAALKQRKLNQ